jgi:outer membrane lipoprotein-sorting protein
MRKINIILALVMVLTFLSACQTDQGKAYMERMGMESDQYDSFVIVLDYGCHPCKDRFYK